METEIWKDIEGYNGKYQVSNMGNVKFAASNSSKRTYLKGSRSHNSRSVLLYIGADRHSHSVKKLVVTHFLGPQPSELHKIIFLNGDTTDCRASNLKWSLDEEKKKCTSCKKEKALKYFNYKGEDLGDVCVHCYKRKHSIVSSTNPLKNVDKIDAICPKCRVKHKANVKWKMCYACSISSDYTDYNGVVYV